MIVLAVPGDDVRAHQAPELVPAQRSQCRTNAGRRPPEPLPGTRWRRRSHARARRCTARSPQSSVVPSACCRLSDVTSHLASATLSKSVKPRIEGVERLSCWWGSLSICSLSVSVDDGPQLVPNSPVSLLLGPLLCPRHSSTGSFARLSEHPAAAHDDFVRLPC
jgi:hypothetical protein